MDDYVFPERKITKIGEETDWETPESVDFAKLIKKVENDLERNPLVIVGILIYANPVLHKMFDKKIFIDINEKGILQEKS